MKEWIVQTLLDISLDKNKPLPIWMTWKDVAKDLNGIGSEPEMKPESLEDALERA